MENEILQSALNYAKQGMKIFPIRNDDDSKAPLTHHGHLDASDDEDQIKRWWKKNPDANIGLPAGINNLIVIDIDRGHKDMVDGYDSIREWQTETGNKLPKDTWTVLSPSGGYHIYFKANNYKATPMVDILPGVDVRAGSSYVLLPPSKRSDGIRYTWEYSPEDCSISEITEDVKALLELKRESKPEKNNNTLPMTIEKGARNDTLFRAAASLQSKGWSDEAIRQAVLIENTEKCVPPEDEATVLKLVDHVIRTYPKGVFVPADHPNAIHEGWHEPEFKLNEKGFILQTIQNASEAIEYDSDLFGSIVYNEIAYSPYIIGSLPWEQSRIYREWDNFDDSHLRSFLQGRYGIKDKSIIDDAFNVVLSRHHYNPLQEMLLTLHQRYVEIGEPEGCIRKLLPKYMGAADNDYNFWAMKIFMRGAIARAFTPGAKFDYVLTLHGKQGTRKSTFFKFLARNDDWFCDSLSNITDTDKAAEKLRGMWIIEMGELLAIVKAKEIEGVKAFLTSTSDDYRPPWKPRTEKRKRMCVFAGTTNSPTFLRDKTGNRRWLVVETHEGLNLFDNIEESNNDIDLAWGEAMKDYLEHKNDFDFLRLPIHMEQLAENVRNGFEEDDPKVGIIAEWLETKSETCAIQILKEALKNDKPTNKDVQDVHLIMRTKIDGWKLYNGNSTHKKRCGSYGSQLCYQKTFDFIDVTDDEMLPT